MKGRPPSFRLQSLALALSIILYFVGLSTPPPAQAEVENRCKKALQVELNAFSSASDSRTPGPLISLTASPARQGNLDATALHPIIESIDLRRLINEEDWSRARLDPRHAMSPWNFYGETTARDWIEAAHWIAAGADDRPIDITLLQDIHRRAMRNHFFTGAVNRRIIAHGRTHSIPSEIYLEEARRVIATRRSERFPDTSPFLGRLRSDAVDDLPHDGSTLIAGTRRVFSRDEYEAMLRNPYMTRDTRQPPEFLPDGTVRARFRYVPPARVEQSTRDILAQLNRDLASARTQEDVILAVVRMNRQMLAAHPFQDGNGRTIRLLGDLVFQRYGLPPPLYPNERDLEMTDTEAVKFILRGMRDYTSEHARASTVPQRTAPVLPIASPGSNP